VAIDVGETTSDDESLTVTPSKHAKHMSPHGPMNRDGHHHPNGDKKAHRHDYDHDHDHGHDAEEAEETLARSGYGNATSPGHSHGSMNMHALLLHVLGDALGNVGVIASGLIIWLSDWKWKFLSDPIISLVITVIIFTSALPLGE
jgi:zinc transporter 1